MLERGERVMEEQHLFQNTNPYIPNEEDIQVLSREESETIWRSRMRTFHPIIKEPVVKVGENSAELGTVISLEHPMATTILEQAAETSGISGNISTVGSQVDILDNLLDYGSTSLDFPMEPSLPSLVGPSSILPEEIQETLWDTARVLKTPPCPVVTPPRPVVKMAPRKEMATGKPTTSSSGGSTSSGCSAADKMSGMIESLENALAQQNVLLKSIMEEMLVQTGVFREVSRNLNRLSTQLEEDRIQHKKESRRGDWRMAELREQNGRDDERGMEERKEREKREGIKESVKRKTEKGEMKERREDERKDRKGKELRESQKENRREGRSKPY